MKKQILLVLLSVACCANTFGQAYGYSSLEGFFKDKGIGTLASLAHPSDEFISYKYRIDYDKIWVDIYYKDGYNTELEVTKTGDVFNNIRVLYDNDFPAPFIGIYFIKETISQSIDRKDESKIEQAFHETIDEMSGTDLACLVLTVQWWNK